MYYLTTFLVGISMLLLTDNLKAQKHCGTVQPPEAFERLRANVANSESRLPGLNDVYIPIYFHLVGRDDGSGVMARSRALESICRINEKFEEIGFKFYIDSIAVINNSSLFTDDGGFENYLKPFYINVFVINTQSGAAGYYNYVDDFIVLKRAFGQSAYDDGYTFEHELGHFFSLFHTHHGWESLPYFPSYHGDTINILEVSSISSRGSVEIELVDGSNCMDAGDGMCDTPPDYGFTSTTGCDCCEMTFELWDYNHDLVGPPMSDNMMAYSRGCDERYFTEMQYAVCSHAF